MTYCGDVLVLRLLVIVQPVQLMAVDLLHDVNRPDPPVQLAASPIAESGRPLAFSLSHLLSFLFCRDLPSHACAEVHRSFRSEALANAAYLVVTDKRIRVRPSR